jgi:hypothetical protein
VKFFSSLLKKIAVGTTTARWSPTTSLIGIVQEALW